MDGSNGNGQSINACTGHKVDSIIRSGIHAAVSLNLLPTIFRLFGTAHMANLCLNSDINSIIVCKQITK